MERSPLPAPTAAVVRQRLDEFRARRGYVLSHQGAMAAALPELQDAYAVIYKVLTIDPHHLGSFEREFVWLALLATAKEGVGTHHVNLFFKEGGSQAQARTCFQLVAWSLGVESFQFLDENWQHHFPEVDARAAYRAGKAALFAGFEGDPYMLHLALLASYAARAQHWGLAVELEDAYAHAVPEAKIAETLSLVMWPCGVNRFLEACDVWLALMRSGKVTPSEAFKAWADTPDQDGFHLAPRAS